MGRSGGGGGRVGGGGGEFIYFKRALIRDYC